VTAPPPSASPRYAEIEPSPALARWIACYWTITADGADTAVRVVPDASADIIFDLAHGARPTAVGTMREAAVHRMRGAVDLFGVRFRPGAALPFFDVAMRELTDAVVPLDDLWGGLADSLADALASAARGERVAVVERTLLERIAAKGRRGNLPAELPARAVALFLRSRGAVNVRDAAAALGVNERALQRAFDESVGISPKALARVLRFRHAVRAIERTVAAGGQPSWTTLAYDAGYADQPHFIREFKSLAGITPAEYAREFGRVGFVQYGDGELR
jgi:AraC-like DNA-binding protein